MTRAPWVPLLLLALSCAKSPEQAPAVTPSAPATPAPKTGVAAAVAGPRELPELRRFFEAERVTGTIAIFDSADGVTSCSDLERCSKGYIPASTFKIPNSMIALETGVVDDSETLLPWDKQQYSVDAWNQDHTLRTAIQVSCVPCFKAIARKVGQGRMADWVKRLGFGNGDISGGIDRFWLSGGLRITPLQQLDFLRRFDGNQLPISERTADIVRDIITLDVGPSHVLRGKTGSALPPDEPHEALWFVGWVELGERRVFFATLIDSHEKDVEILPARRRLTEAVLRDQKLLP